eukprot:SAG31_NODE_2949_length_4871_cov_2.742456_2_plen_214_part_00
MWLAENETGGRVDAGVGVMLGPILSQRLLVPILGHARFVFAVNVGLLGICAAVCGLAVDETLDKEQRKPMDWIACNPLNFVAMLKSSWSMFWLMVTSGLQTCIDGYNIVVRQNLRALFALCTPLTLVHWAVQESNFVYQRDQLGFNQAQQSNYLTFAGVKIIMGGLLGKPLTQRLGQLGLTTFSNFANFSAQAIGMLASGPLGMCESSPANRQ